MSCQHIAVPLSLQFVVGLCMQLNFSVSTLAVVCLAVGHDLYKRECSGIRLTIGLTDLQYPSS
jgi:hypothetical protein